MSLEFTGRRKDQHNFWATFVSLFLDNLNPGVEVYSQLVQVFEWDVKVLVRQEMCLI
jgi:hypothetical protein